MIFKASLVLFTNKNLLMGDFGYILLIVMGFALIYFGVFMKKKVFLLKRFLKVDLWEINLRNLSSFKAAIVKFVRIMVLSFHGFLADKCPLQASALTFYTIFSIVPLAAMVFGIAQGFKLKEKLQALLNKNFADYQVLLDKLYEMADKALAKAQGSTIAIIGLLLLFFTVIKVVGNVEHSFNDIWGVKTARKLFRKCGDYTILLIVCPALLLFSSSVTVFINTLINEYAKSSYGITTVAEFMTFLTIKFIPYLSMWTLFTFIYKTMPNTKVKFFSALFAGIIAGSIFQILQQYYIVIQVAVSNQSAIYGSFTAVPLFLMWLQISWFIVLFGAEISFAHQNVDTFECDPYDLNISGSLQHKLEIKATFLVVKAFVGGLKPVSDSEIARDCGVPIRGARDILYKLCKAGVITKVVDINNDESGFVPAIPLEKLSIQFVWESVDSVGRSSFPLPELKKFAKLDSQLKAFADDCVVSEHNKLIKDL